MSGYCRICSDEDQDHSSDSYAACTNCGSFVCRKHYKWLKLSRDVFCVNCIAPQAAKGAATAADATDALLEPTTGQLHAIARELSTNPALRELIYWDEAYSEQWYGEEVDYAMLRRIRDILWHVSMIFGLEYMREE